MQDCEMDVNVFLWELQVAWSDAHEGIASDCLKVECDPVRKLFPGRVGAPSRFYESRMYVVRQGQLEAAA